MCDKTKYMYTFSRLNWFFIFFFPLLRAKYSIRSKGNQNVGFWDKFLDKFSPFFNESFLEITSYFGGKFHKISLKNEGIVEPFFIYKYLSTRPLLVSEVVTNLFFFFWVPLLFYINIDAPTSLNLRQRH